MATDHKDPRSREDRALDALIAATIRHAELNDVSASDVEAFCARPTALSAESRRAIAALGPNVVQKIVAGIRHDCSVPASCLRETVAPPQYVAMNRKDPKEKPDAVTEAELTRLRKKLLGGE